MKPIIRASFVTALLSLSACSTGLIKTSSDSAQSTPPLQKESQKTELQDFDLEKDTLYDLLVAEVAAQRNQFSITLLNYIQQARMTRDPEVIKRAINAAQLLKDMEAVQEMAILWVDVSPDSIPAHQLLAFQYSLQKNYTDAISHIESILRLGGDARVDSLALSSKTLPKEDKELLLQLYQDLYSKHPNNNEVGYSYALIQRNLEQYDAALSTLQPIIKNSPDFEPPSILKANLLYDLGKLQEAIDYADDKFNDFPHNHNLGRLYASMLIENKQLDKAEEVFKSLMDLYPQAPSLKLSHALVMLENQKVEAAAKSFNELITAKAHTNESNFYLGRIADKNGEVDKAIEHYKSVKQGIHFDSALERSSFLLAKSDNIDEMIARLSELRKQRPEISLNLWLLEFKILSTVKQETRAMETLEKAVSEFPNDEQLLYARAMNYESQDKLSEMEKDLRTIIQNNPKNAVAINALGYTLADRTDRIEEAFSLVQLALSIKPENPAILDSMGWILFKLNKKEDALIFLLKAFQNYPDPEVAAHLGEVLWKLNQTTQASEILLNNLKQHPEHKVLLDTIKRLNPSLLEQAKEEKPSANNEGTDTTSENADTIKEDQLDN